ncbi:hypothetical protein FA15DRAFT_661365 [Coprinopsis marcescibilis]|uniref:Uncharacterized protein n=1 Tax=Coprinopsis marcescibilis TaxID=230819 RepID=A0A5C3KC73_COPMA|nr:hypothetical protein FA15DRAFT_661365 [Coprinopsis marcescibilis]
MSHPSQSQDPSTCIPDIKWADNDHKLIWELITEAEKPENCAMWFGKAEKTNNLYGYHTAAVEGPYNGRTIAVWWPHRDCMAAARTWHGGRTEIARWTHGDCTAAAWRLHGGRTDMAQSLHSSSTAAARSCMALARRPHGLARPWHGPDMAPARRPHGLVGQC